ncbi:hypothetical protein B296_00034321 [Ensete ventricosum]|uniref:Uncharacterized protein n=1 Tax=Ensete ventricosum TaxID=4639 RepID=A0A426Z669_ENSVE|nr:hypothetical protein B296_00034321 [Ensete ventricosum]
MVGRDGRCIYIDTQNTEIKWRIRDDDGNKEAGKDAEEAIILIFQGVSVKAEMTTGGDRGGEESLSKQRPDFGCFPLLSPLSPTGPVIGSSSGIEHGPRDTADRYTFYPETKPVTLSTLSSAGYFLDYSGPQYPSIRTLIAIHVIDHRLLRRTADPLFYIDKLGACDVPKRINSYRSFWFRMRYGCGLETERRYSIDPRVYRFSRTSRRTRPPAHEKAVGVGGRMNAVDGGVWVEERNGPPPPAGQLSACGAACEMPAES